MARAMAETLKLPLRDVLTLCEALSSLDGSRQGKDEINIFEFEPKVSWALAKNAGIVAPHKVAFEKACRQQAKQARVAPGESIKAGEEVPLEKRERFDQLTEAIETLKDEPTELSGILFLKLADLRNKPKDKDGDVGRNAIPQSVINKLAPLIREDETK